MKEPRVFILNLAGVLFLSPFNLYSISAPGNSAMPENKAGNFKIGWSSVDITPDKPVLLAGQMYVRVSEGVQDPITATALALEYGTGDAAEKAIMISCDLVSISDILKNTVRTLLKHTLPEVSSEQIFLNATHTHTAPTIGTNSDIIGMYGVDLGVMSPAECLKYISERVAKAAEEAWKNRKPGGISFGLGQAIVGHNRLAIDMDGKSVMYRNTNFPGFSHQEGSVDHSVNLLYTWDKKSKLTGVIINIACPSQVTEGLVKVSADYWHDTRLEVRKRLGKDIYILPQCSAAGDQSPHILIGQNAETRMQRLITHDSINSGRTSLGQRKQIAIRIADAVTSVYPYMKEVIEWDPVFIHRTELVELSRNKVVRRLPDASNRPVVPVDTNSRKANELKYNQLLKAINENPELKKKPQWYLEIIDAYSKIKRSEGRTGGRSEAGQQPDKIQIEVHVLRLGDVVFASNPFELYLDYGMRIKARSPATQTFLVQLTGGGSYVASARSVSGGSYGASGGRIGPEGGQELVEQTLNLINELWIK